MTSHTAASPTAAPAPTAASRTVLRGARWPGDIAVADGIIAEVGTVEPQPGDVVVDVEGDIITAGLANTHHHLYQWMTRGRAVGCDLFGWLVELYPVWGRLTVEDVAAAALVGLGELAATGCTSAADHHYLVPHGDDAVFDAIVEAAAAVGIRLHLSRGSMDLGESKGGLPPDHVVESLDSIMASTERVIDRYHDGDMVHVVVAPCSPFSVSSELMEASADLARQHGLRLHTHLCETIDEQEHCLERFGRRPVEQLDDWGWVGDDVWLAHGIWINDDRDREAGLRRSGGGPLSVVQRPVGGGHLPGDRLGSRGRTGRPRCGRGGVQRGRCGLFPELRQSLYAARLRAMAPRRIHARRRPPAGHHRRGQVSRRGRPVGKPGTGYGCRYRVVAR